MPNSSENDAMPQWVMGDLPGQNESGQPVPPEAQEPGMQEDGQSEDAAGAPAILDGRPVEAAAEAAPEADAPNEMDALLAEAEVANAAAIALAHGQADQHLERLAAVTPLLAGVLEALMTEFDELGGEAEVAEPPAQAERPVEGRAAEKPRKRAKKAKEPKPAAPVAAAEAVEALSQAAGGQVVTMGPVSTNGHLNLEALVESLLFVADGAVPVARLAEALEIHPREVEAALAALAESYQERGLSLQRFRDKVQLTTSPAAAALVERFLGLAASTPLSRAALEALAIIAYQQPVTRPQIEAVRGVNSDSVIKNLLTKGLIEEAGRAEGPGRPVLYSTTSEFMQHFGLATLSDLPPLTPPAAAPEHSFNFLVCFMSFACHQHNVSFFCHHTGHLDCLFTVGNHHSLTCITWPDAGLHFLDDGHGLFVSWVIGGEHNFITQTTCD